MLNMKRSDLSFVGAVISCAFAVVAFLCVLPLKTPAGHIHHPWALAAFLVGANAVPFFFMRHNAWAYREKVFLNFVGVNAPNSRRDTGLRALIQPKVDARMNELWERISRLKVEIDQFNGRSIASCEDIARFEKIRESIRSEREYYEMKRAIVRSFGFQARSERKRSKELAKGRAA